MSLPILNFKLSGKPEYTLRAIAVLSFPPGFFILLVHGIASGRVNPAIGILPLFFSSALCAFLNYRSSQTRCNCKGLSGQPIFLVADFLLAIALLAELIITWVCLSDWGSHTVIATYGTNFLIINFSIHAYLGLQYIYESLTSSSYYPSSCPECQFLPFPSLNNKGRRQVDGRVYDPLLDDVQEEGPQYYQNPNPANIKPGVGLRDGLADPATAV